MCILLVYGMCLCMCVRMHVLACVYVGWGGGGGQEGHGVRLVGRLCVKADVKMHDMHMMCSSLRD